MVVAADLCVLWVLQDGGLQQQHCCVQVSLSCFFLTLGEDVGRVSIRVVGVEVVTLKKPEQKMV